MATTESRIGFRLPWSADRAASRDDFDESQEIDPSLSDDGSMAPGLDAVEVLDPSPGTDVAASGAPEAPVDTGHLPSAALESSLPASPAVLAEGPARRPTKFLADLTHAMQAAAEQARAATLEQFRVDGSAYVERIQGRSVTDADALRRRADEDVASIKDWSKAEIARIREEADTRISGRRSQLDGQLARHAALVEQDVARIEGQIEAFEAEMAAFFDELLAESDLTLLAARAQQMPEAPAFDEPDETAFAALLTEPAAGIPGPKPEPEPAILPTLEAAPTSEPEPTARLDEGVADDGATPAEASPADDLPIDREAAMAAIQAAAEAAAALEAEAAAAGEAGDAGAPVRTTEWDDAPQSGDEISPEAGDPRLAMLGLAPEFVAAEFAAAEAAAAEIQEIPEMDEQDLTARLAGLVPSSSTVVPAAANSSVPAISTQVIVSGLVSVASIASFKRHLSRAAGVRHVGVSSGPDGEFLFTVQHEAEMSLRDLIPSLPGFNARVTGDGDGVVMATAHDPED